MREEFDKERRETEERYRKEGNEFQDVLGNLLREYTSTKSDSVLNYAEKVLFKLKDKIRDCIIFLGNNGIEFSLQCTYDSYVKSFLDAGVPTRSPLYYDYPNRQLHDSLDLHLKESGMSLFNNDILVFERQVVSIPFLEKSMTPEEIESSTLILHGDKSRILEKFYIDIPIIKYLYMSKEDAIERDNKKLWFDEKLFELFLFIKKVKEKFPTKESFVDYLKKHFDFSNNLLNGLIKNDKARLYILNPFAEIPN